MKIPPGFLHPTNLRNDRRIQRVMKDLPNGSGFGTVVWLLERLACEKDFQYPMNDIDLLSDESGISQAIIESVVRGYGIFTVVEKEEEYFFSIDLNNWLSGYFETIKKRSKAGKKSALVKENKYIEHEQELKLNLLENKNKLSVIDSIIQDKINAKLSDKDSIQLINKIKNKKNIRIEKDDEYIYIKNERGDIEEKITRYSTKVKEVK